MITFGNMASITVRNLPDSAKEGLRVQAARQGVALETYIRTILVDTSKGRGIKTPSLVGLFDRHFGHEKGVELELPERSTKRGPVGFDG